MRQCSYEWLLSSVMPPDSFPCIMRELSAGLFRSLQVASQSRTCPESRSVCMLSDTRVCASLLCISVVHMQQSQHRVGHPGLRIAVEIFTLQSWQTAARSAGKQSIANEPMMLKLVQIKLKVSTMNPSKSRRPAAAI